MNRVAVVLFFMLSPMFTLAEQPIIKFRYSPVFDSWCTRSNGTEIPPGELEQLIGKVEAMQAEWDALGPRLLATTENLIGKPFLRREVTATLFLCGRTPSMSLPLLINGNWFVEGKNQLPVDMATHIVFHELLHIYLVDHFMGRLALRDKYEAEGEHFLVLNHLHLLAVQKLVYLELGLGEVLARVIANDSKLAQGKYERAWGLVNEVGHEKFVADLQ